MRTKILVTLLLLTAFPEFVTGQNESVLDVKAVAKNFEKRFQDCPRREVVGRFDRKHHKQVWQKQAWGPPTDVFVDIKANDSMLYPYLMFVEFSLGHSFGPERQSQSDAAKDVDLSQNPTLAALLKGKYRNVYFLSKDDIKLKSRELQRQELDGKASTWEQRPSWPDACWDQINTR
jgi:hypothetical protein